MIKLSETFQGLDAYAVLEELVGAKNIQETGSELMHSCPLPFGMHKNGDANPSASLNRESLLFNCFTCGGGSIIWLVENTLDISRDEAILELKKFASGLRDIPAEKFIEMMYKLFKKEESKALDIPIYNDRIIGIYECNSDYLTNRGISSSVQKKMRTGLHKDKRELDKRGEIVLVDRVIIPHFMNGKLVGWVGRKTDDWSPVAKYKNSKGFPRQYWLYNLDNVKDMETCIVVESPMSVLNMLSRGIDNVVATFGAKVSKPQMELLRNFKEVTIFMDGDHPGRAAANTLVNTLKNYTKLKVVKTPDGEDPASIDYVPNVLSTFEYELSNY